MLSLIGLGIQVCQGVEAERRLAGLIYGAAIGDALGGPVEFQTRSEKKFPNLWIPLDKEVRLEWGRTLEMEVYTREIHPYGPWVANAPAGTITDDTRAKLLMVRAGLRAGGWTRVNLAKEILHWYEDGPLSFIELSRQNMEEFAYAAKWELSDYREGKPPYRLWGGLPTMAGQMFFPVLAAGYPGDPESAYRHVYRINFLDTGMAKDFTAGLVAGLAEALRADAAWDDVFHAMRATDPFDYASVPWVSRRFTDWLDQTESMAMEAQGVPGRLFEILDRDLKATTHWECWVPVAVGFACAHLADFDPLATLNLILAYGHDTDSNAQIMAAFFGALGGPEIYPEAWRSQVDSRLRADFETTIPEILFDLRKITETD